MPVNTWNFYRAVSVGSDHKSWLSQNPQVEDGRIGGNQEFESDVTDQYQYEVNHMMRRLRLNFYRAEDAFLVMKKKQWEAEDKQFAKLQADRKRKAQNKRILQNRQRRERKDMERRSLSLPSLNQEFLKDDFTPFKPLTLRSSFLCNNCQKEMSASVAIFQCSDGHILCEDCTHTVEACTECGKPISGRNYTMERIARLVFGAEDGDDGDNPEPSAPSEEDKLNLTSISDSSA